MSNAFEPTNPTDSCAYCGRARANLWHRVTSDPGTHAFVDPAPQPDIEALKERGDGDDCEECEFDASYRCEVCGEDSCGEHAMLHECPQPAPSGDEAKVREVVEKWMDKLPGVSSFDIEAIAKAGYAAGKADGAREATEKAWEWVATVASKEEADECREFIARRGSEGK